MSTSTSSVVSATTTATSTTLVTTTKAATQTTASTAVCTGSFNAISASDFVANLHPGWNLGNTLDAVPDEGSWNNSPVEESTFDTVKAAGFKSIRIPGKPIGVLHGRIRRIDKL